MRPAATITCFGPVAAGAVSRLDATALSCDVLPGGPALWAQLKERNAGSYACVLLDEETAASLAAAVEATRILRRRGSVASIISLPPCRLDSLPPALLRLRSLAAQIGACVVQPAAPASPADVVRCFVEPLAVFGLIGVDPAEFDRLLAAPAAATVHRWEHPAPMPPPLAEALRRSSGAILSCRLRPQSTLLEVDDVAARAAREQPPGASFILAGPEVGIDDGPAAVAAVF
jgi:hypothetical protein